MGYTDLQDDYGHLLARYDPVRRLLEIKRHRQVYLFDLDTGQQIGSLTLPPRHMPPPIVPNDADCPKE